MKKLAVSLAIITSLSVGAVEMEQSSQIKHIKDKQGISIGMTQAMMVTSKSHAKDVKKELVRLYKEDGEVHGNNFELHQWTLNNLFDELKEKDELPVWYFGPGTFTNDERVRLVHDLLIE